MVNPWNAIGDAPDYVLEEDRPHIEAFNAMLPAGNERHRLMLSVPPSPIHGLYDAPVVVLLANPLYSEQAEQSFEDEAWRQKILFELHADGGTRFHALDEEWAQNQGGIWWRKCLGALHAKGVEWDILAERVLSIDFHGYFSQEWAALPITLPSQRYGFQLVESAIAREAVIVILRAERFWKVAVPGLRDHPDRVFVANNPRRSSVSPGNLPVGAFDRVLDKLR